MFYVVERDLARHLRELDDEVDVPDGDKQKTNKSLNPF